MGAGSRHWGDAGMMAAKRSAMPTIISETLATFEPGEPAAYPIDFVARCTGVPRHRIGVYCRSGLIETVGDPSQDGWRFGAVGIRELRRAEEIRKRVGDNLAAIKAILSLTHEIELLERRLREVSRE